MNAWWINFSLPLIGSCPFVIRTCIVVWWSFFLSFNWWSVNVWIFFFWFWCRSSIRYVVNPIHCEYNDALYYWSCHLFPSNPIDAYFKWKIKSSFAIARKNLWSNLGTTLIIFATDLLLFLIKISPRPSLSLMWLDIIVGQMCWALHWIGIILVHVHISNQSKLEALRATITHPHLYILLWNQLIVSCYLKSNFQVKPFSLCRAILFMILSAHSSTSLCWIYKRILLVIFLCINTKPQ